MHKWLTEKENIVVVGVRNDTDKEYKRNRLINANLEQVGEEEQNTLDILARTNVLLPLTQKCSHPDIV